MPATQPQSAVPRLLYGRSPVPSRSPLTSLLSASRPQTPAPAPHSVRGGLAGAPAPRSAPPPGGLTASPSNPRAAIAQTLSSGQPLDPSTLLGLVSALRQQTASKTAPAARTPHGVHQASPQAPAGHPQFQVEGPASARDLKAIGVAKQYLGTPYVWGGESPHGFDCSGLLQYVWAKQGVSIPRTTYDQWKHGKAVAKGQLRPGDAVFFRGSDARGNLPGHVGIYIGGGKFIEAPHTGATVRISKLKGRTDYQGARRYG